MNCPGSEQAAAYADGRLDSADSARYLEHCADCDECRRTLAILHQPLPESAVPPAMEARAISSLRRSLDRESPKVDELRVEEPAKPVTQTVAARLLSEIQVTDIAGPVNVHRKGAKAKERLSGVARLAEGDVLSTDKPACFQVEGRYPVVL